MCDEVVAAFLEILNLKESELAGHDQRVAELALKLGERLGLSPEELIDLKRGALLHDIGKICIPDEILNKPSPLTDQEYEVIKQHTGFGASILGHISCLERALVVAASHHEKWDGSGYPDALQGEEIPLLAQISSVAGTYDALTNARPYRAALSKAEALQFISERAGKAYDPRITETFLRMAAEAGG
jgi:putative nucleotidyltransferase with HDIG domain